MNQHIFDLEEILRCLRQASFRLVELCNHAPQNVLDELVGAHPKLTEMVQQIEAAHRAAKEAKGQS